MSKKKSFYRTIETKMYSDEKFMSLSRVQPSGQSLWIYLLTGVFTGPIPGLYRAGRLAMSEELEWLPKRFDECFEELSSNGLAKANWNKKIIYIKNAINHNPPSNPNMIIGWQFAWKSIPECELKLEAYNGIKSYFELEKPHLLKTFLDVIDEPILNHAKGLGNGYRNGSANQEQEQEQEQEQYQEQEQEQEKDISSLRSSKKIGDVRKIFDHWVLVMKPRRATLTPKLDKLIRAQLKIFPLDEICLAIDGCVYDDWLMGRDVKTNGKKFNSLDYIFREKHFQKLIEYAESPPVKPLELTNEQKLAIENENSTQAFLKKLRGESDDE